MPQQPQTPAAQVVPVGVGPMFSGGPDASRIPEGTVRLAKNMLMRPKRLVMRPPWVDAGLVTGTLRSGQLVLWEDTSSSGIRYNGGQFRVISLFNTSIYAQSITGMGAQETWVTISSNDPGVQNGLGYLGDSFNFRGILYYVGNIYSLHDNYAQVHYGRIASFNGTTVLPALSSYVDSPVPDNMQASSICVFMDRIFLGNANASVNNLLTNGAPKYAYDLTSWMASSGISINNLSTLAGTVCRITPTSTTSAYVRSGYTSGTLAVSSVSYVTKFAYCADLRGVDSSYNVPLTLEIYVTQTWAASTAFTVGTVVTPTVLNGNRFRVTVAGTSSGTEPTWPTTLGGTVTDGSVTWINEGPDALSSSPIIVVNATDAGWQRFSTAAAVAPNTTTRIGARIKWGNTSTPSGWSLASVDVSLKDGLADSDNRKSNKGQQITQDGYPYPFFNAESVGTVYVYTPIYDLVWSEVLDFKTVRAANYYNLKDVPGIVTCVRAVDNRLYVFKRRGLFIFQGTNDPDQPIVMEQRFVNIGCLHPKAWTVFEGFMYFIGENEIYRYSPGSIPLPLCGDGMREEIMNKGAGWVENQGENNVYWATPLIEVDQINRDLYVYTQAGKIYVYHLPPPSPFGAYAQQQQDMSASGWTVIDIQGSGGAQQLQDLRFNPSTGHMYASTYPEYGVRRLDAALTSSDVDRASVNYQITADVVFKSIETDPRQDVLVNWLDIYHAATAAQTGQTTTAYASFDQGTSWAKNVTGTLKPSPGGAISARFDLFQRGPSITPRITHVGNGGEANFNITRAAASVLVEREEYPTNRPTVTGGNL